MRFNFLILLSIAMFFFLSGCKELTQHNIDLDGVDHGEKLYGGAKNCTVCHGASLSGHGPIPGCNNCHDDLWSKAYHNKNRGGIKHHSGISSPATCGSCHGGNSLTGKRSRPSCYTCHEDLWSATANHTVSKDGYLHAPGLKSPTQSCNNSACHGINLTGGTKGPSCYSCHGNEWDGDDDD